ncbi:MAG: hypothetical protein ACOCXV_01865 [Bacteroidota bacterium]
MDELKKLKKVWDTSFADPSESLNHEELLKIIRQKSSGPVDRLKKSLYLEIGTILVVLPLLVVVMIKLSQPYFILNTSILILLFISTLSYYYINLRKISRIWEEGQENLRSSIESTLALLKFFRKTYYYINIVLFPLGIYFGYILGFGLGSGGERVTSLLLFPSEPLFLNILVYITAGCIAFVLFLLLLRFWVRKLYDVHIKKLHQVYAELTENDSPVKPA